MQISKEKVLEYLKTVSVTQWFYIALSFFVFVNDLFLFIDFDDMVYWNTEAVLGIFSFYVITLFLYTPIALGIITHNQAGFKKSRFTHRENVHHLFKGNTPHYYFIWYLRLYMVCIKTSTKYF